MERHFVRALKADFPDHLEMVDGDLCVSKSKTYALRTAMTSNYIHSVKNEFFALAMAAKARAEENREAIRLAQEVIDKRLVGAKEKEHTAFFKAKPGDTFHLHRKTFLSKNDAAALFCAPVSLLKTSSDFGIGRYSKLVHNKSFFDLHALSVIFESGDVAAAHAQEDGSTLITFNKEFESVKPYGVPSISYVFCANGKTQKVPSNLTSSSEKFCDIRDRTLQAMIGDAETNVIQMRQTPKQEDENVFNKGETRLEEIGTKFIRAVVSHEERIKALENVAVSRGDRVFEALSRIERIVTGEREAELEDALRKSCELLQEHVALISKLLPGSVKKIAA